MTPPPQSAAIRDLVVVVSPFEEPHARVVSAAARAGALGLLDLGREPDAARRAFDELARWLGRGAGGLAGSDGGGSGRYGVRVPAGCPTGPDGLPPEVDTVLLADSARHTPEQVAAWARAVGRPRIWAEVTSPQEAAAAVAAGAEALVARGHEAGGRVGGTTSFVLLQQLLGDSGPGVPVRVCGGIGPHTAAAAVAGGAAGVLLDVQLALTAEVEEALPAEVAAVLRAMDGSETRLADGHRVFTRPDLSPPEGPVPALLGARSLRAQLLPVGQDGASAARLAARHRTTGGVVQAVRAAVTGHLEAAVRARPLERPYPVAQGPMTRVSDQAAFAEAVAAAGGLPYLALAVMEGPDVRALLAGTAARLGDRPWGVGLLGFAPEALRREQLAAVAAARPPYAIIAGGTPAQAAPLEAAGIRTHLHVPSPGLLERYLTEGARRFVFEGLECGGHVGPRASFPLWEEQIELLLSCPEPRELDVLFAGGVHDERSAAMAVAAAAPLAARGARVGVLMGTAYLFTREAVDCGAVLPVFQRTAVECAETVLLHTAPGHATRCAPTPYTGAFEATRQRLTADGTEPRAVWEELERLNLGRLRLAAKGLRRRTGEPGGAGAEDAGAEDARPEGAGPENAGAKGAGPESTGTTGAGAESAGPENAWPENAGPKGTGPKGAGSEDARAEDAGAEGARPESGGPKGVGPESAWPDDAGPKGAGSEDTRPEDTRPEDTRPEDTRPEDTRPEDTRPEDTGPKGAGPKGAGPKGAGPERAGSEDAGPESAGLEGVGSEGVGSGSAGVSGPGGIGGAEGAGAGAGGGPGGSGPGRLAVARPGGGALPAGSAGADRRLEAVDEEQQYAEGLFMLGQAAALRSATTTVAELHAQVTEGATRFLERRARELLVPQERDAAGAAAGPLEVAIVGMACAYPGSPDLAAYWARILDGTDAVTEVPAERWDPALYYDPDPARAGERTPSRWGGFLGPVPFDALAHGIPPASLAGIEPVQLLALEISARALADAGYDKAREFDRSRTAVVFGAEAGTELAGAYGLRALLPSYLGAVPAGLDGQLPRLTEDSFPGVLANVIAGRVANRLDLGGANCTVDAACASSLAALDLACRQLRDGDADMVLCGGADLHNGINDYLMFSSVRALSPGGRCRPFDTAADGIALGEGVGVLVLKRLADAERAGDRVYAVVKAVGSASDGRSLGLTAPRPEGQRRALERAYARAGISPAEVGLVEAHGTGTVVGDSTELTVLTELFTEAGAAPGSCALGSVKSQIGHTKCAAGLAGLIKAARAVHAGVRPPTLHVEAPNPAWREADSPFFFDAQARPWAVPAGRRIAGVSAFGFGGTNYHAVLAGYEGAAGPAHGLEEWPAELFCFRGEDRRAAGRVMARLAARLEENDAAGRPWALRDLAAEAAASGSGPVRVAVVAGDLTELAARLERARAFAPGAGVHVREEEAAEPGGVAFLFPGQGSQRPGMLGELFTAFPALRGLLDEAPADVVRAMFPPASFGAEGRAARRAAVTDTRVAQPALGLAGAAAHLLLGRLGVRPDAVAGHSYGELTALWAAGVYGMPELLRLSVRRAEAILAAAGADPGTMAAVSAAPEEVRGIAERAGCVVANHNAPRQCVVSGPAAAVERVVSALREAGLSAQPIPVACAFHSEVVAGAAGALAAELAGTELGGAVVPVWSNTTAAPYPADADGVRALLARQVAEPVRFVEQVEGMYAAGVRTFVEAGPGRVLCGLVGRILEGRPHTVVPLDVPGEHGLVRLVTALAELVAAGVPVDPEALFRGRTRRLPERAPNRPGWLVDGHLVRTAVGTPVPGGLHPARRLPLPAPVPATAPGGPSPHPPGPWTAPSGTAIRPADPWTAPGGTAAYPSNPWTVPDGSTDHPAPPWATPGGTASHPSAPWTAPGGTTDHPAPPWPTPGGTAAHLSDPWATPGGTTDHPAPPWPTPGGTTAHPSDPWATPGGTTGHPAPPWPTPGGTTAHPSDPWATPGGTTDHPADPSNTPGGTMDHPTQPRLTPGGEAAHPSDPWNTPGGTTDRRADPWTTPGVTARRPAEPWTTPGGPVPHPSAPWTTPSGTTDRPTQPWATPGGTAAHPSDPWATPGRTAAHPAESGMTPDGAAAYPPGPWTAPPGADSAARWTTASGAGVPVADLRATAEGAEGTSPDPRTDLPARGVPAMGERTAPHGVTGYPPDFGKALNGAAFPFTGSPSAPAWAESQPPGLRNAPAWAAVDPSGLPTAPYGAGGPPGGPRDAAVLEYLRGARELVAAQREVLVGYLGAGAFPAGQAGAAWRGEPPVAASGTAPAPSAAGQTAWAQAASAAAPPDAGGMRMPLPVTEAGAQAAAGPWAAAAEPAAGRGTPTGPLPWTPPTGSGAGWIPVPAAEAGSWSAVADPAAGWTPTGPGDGWTPAAGAGGAAAPAPWAAPAASADGAGPELPPGATGSGGAGPRTAEEVMEVVLEIVQTRTGYPPDMLDPGLDLEADLSIDSIKRVEIIGALADRIGLPRDAGGSEGTAVEELSRIKTLRGIVDWVVAHAGGTESGRSPEPDAAAFPLPTPTPWYAPDADPGPAGTVPPPDGTQPPAPAGVTVTGTDSPPAGDSAGGTAAVAAQAPAAGPGATAWDGTLPTGSGPGAAARTTGAPARGSGVRRGSEAVVRLRVDVVPVEAAGGDPGRLRGLRVGVVGDGQGVADALAGVLREHGAEVGVLGDAEGGWDGIVDLSGLRGGTEPVLPGAFAGLRRALVGGAGRLVLAGVPGAAGAGLHGFARSAALEFPGTLVRAVEVHPKEEPGRIAAHLLAELGGAPGDGGPVSVGYALDGTRFVRRPVPAALYAAGEPAPPLGPDSVVLLTGGARGITARTALALARATGCHVELLGRTPQPPPVPDEFGQARDRVALRAALIASGLRTPAEIEAAASRILAEREVRATLAALSGVAASVRYHRADVTDEDAVRAVVADVRARHGRLDGLVHGAGLLRDGLLRDKRPEDFAEVFAAKVDGARHLAAAAADHGDGPAPRFLALFGSVAGVYGNRGQSDYGAANDALDGLAHTWARSFPGRVLAVDWGPWAAEAGGMVTPELARAYAGRGIPLIDPDAGTAAFLAELAHGSDVQVVLMAAAPVPAAGGGDE